MPSQFLTKFTTKKNWLILGLKKDLNKAAKLDASGRVSSWTKSVVTHMYWVAASTSPTDTEHWSDTMEAKWMSLSNHISGLHKHANPYFTKCAHRAKKKGDKKKDYLRKGRHTTI